MRKSCPICGIDYRHIAQMHRLGCAFCYFTFKTEMMYVFQMKQDNNHTHKGKKPKNFTNPVNIFLNQEIERKIDDADLKAKLKSKIKLNFYSGD